VTATTAVAGVRGRGFTRRRRRVDPVAPPGCGACRSHGLVGVRCILARCFTSPNALRMMVLLGFGGRGGRVLAVVGVGVRWRGGGLGHVDMSDIGL
jgi:hypothetical protein